MAQVFISYSHIDEKWKKRLQTHLGVLEREGRLSVWEDRQITPGADWLPEIETALNTAHIAILLISPDLLNSSFILEKEIPPLLQRRAREGLRIIPLIIRPCAWQAVDWLASIQGYPKDNRPLSGGNDHQIDEDLANLAITICYSNGYGWRIRISGE